MPYLNLCQIGIFLNFYAYLSTNLAFSCWIPHKNIRTTPSATLHFCYVSYFEELSKKWPGFNFISPSPNEQTEHRFRPDNGVVQVFIGGIQHIALESTLRG